MLTHANVNSGGDDIDEHAKLWLYIHICMYIREWIQNLRKPICLNARMDGEPFLRTSINRPLYINSYTIMYLLLNKIKWFWYSKWALVNWDMLGLECSISYEDKRTECRIIFFFHLNIKFVYLCFYLIWVVFKNLETDALNKWYLLFYLCLFEFNSERSYIKYTYIINLDYIGVTCEYFRLPFCLTDNMSNSDKKGSIHKYIQDQASNTGPGWTRDPSIDSII